MTTFSRSTTTKSTTRMLCTFRRLLNRAKRKHIKLLPRIETRKRQVDRKSWTAMVITLAGCVSSSDELEFPGIGWIELFINRWDSSIVNNCQPSGNESLTWLSAPDQVWYWRPEKVLSASLNVREKYHRETTKYKVQRSPETQWQMQKRNLSIRNVDPQCHGCCFCRHLQYNFRRPQTNEKTYKTTEITEQKFRTFVVCRSTQRVKHSQ